MLVCLSSVTLVVVSDLVLENCKQNKYTKTKSYYSNWFHLHMYHIFINKLHDCSEHRGILMTLDTMTSFEICTDVTKIDI